MDEMWDALKNYYNHLMLTGYSKDNNRYRLLLLITLNYMLQDYRLSKEECKVLKGYFLRCGSECF